MTDLEKEMALNERLDAIENAIFGILSYLDYDTDSEQKRALEDIRKELYNGIKDAL